MYTSHTIESKNPPGRPVGSKNKPKTTDSIINSKNDNADQPPFRWNQSRILCLKTAILNCKEGIDGVDNILIYLRSLGWTIERDTVYRRLYRPDIQEWWELEGKGEHLARISRLTNQSEDDDSDWIEPSVF